MPNRTGNFRRAGALALAVILLALPACSGNDDSPGSDDAVAVPEGLEVAISDDPRPAVTISFAPVPDADGYLLGFDAGQPIRATADDCPERCELSFDRLATAGATTVNVTALQGGTRSDTSADIELPAWPEPTPRPTAPPEGEPVTLVVTRESAEGKPVVETEEVPAGEDVHARIDALNAEEDVLGVGVDIPGSLQSAAQAPAATAVPEGDGTWQREAMEFDILPESRGRGVQVAVLDDYVDTAHPNLQLADVTAIDTIAPESTELGDHGTGVTTFIVGGEGGRIPGIATSATVKAYDVFNNGGLYNHGQVASAIIRAVDDGADVLNLSLTLTCDWLDFARGGCAEDVLRPAIDYAEREGVVVVAAAGNDGTAWCAEGDEPNKDSWPAKFESVIAVAATERDGDDYLCNPDKDYIDVKAPGMKLLVAKSPDQYKIGSGTSYSAPLMAGLIACLLAEAPDLTPSEIRELIARSVDSNKRIIVSALFMAAGIDLDHEGPVIDPSTARQWCPSASSSTSRWTPRQGSTRPSPTTTLRASTAPAASSGTSSPTRPIPSSWVGCSSSTTKDR